ncbi:MAG: response regulator [Deltaproteobacteria bacterium]|nr:response regulator [Deltaproteobacteria bacterium]
MSNIQSGGAAPAALEAVPPVALVVDDDKGVGNFAVQALEYVGFTVHQAEDGLGGLSIFEQQRPDIVLLDVMMPKMDGIAACAAIRGMPGGRLTPILMMTGLNDIESVNRAFEAGATDFISKPFNSSVLGYRTRYLLRAARAFHAAQTAEEHYSRLYRDQQEIAGRLLSLMNNVPGVTYRGIRDWTVTFISVKVKKLTGYTPEDFLSAGIVWRDLVLPEDFDTLKKAYRAAVQERKGILRVEYRIRHKDGTIRWIEDRRQLIYTPEMDFAYVDGLLLDITERKAMDAALADEKTLLEAAQRELTVKNDELNDAYSDLKSAHAQMLQKEKMASIGLLAAGIAHEINNPIGFVASNLLTLEKYVGRFTEFSKAAVAVAAEALPASAAEFEGKRKALKVDRILEDVVPLIRESIEGTTRVSKIVSDLKSFSRVDDSGMKNADLNECLSSTINIAWNEIKYKAVLHKEFGDLPPVLCWPQQLNQVFMNLLVNAAQAIEKEGEITVRSWTEGDAVLVSVSDTGCGIPRDNLNRIFEPFFTTKEVGKGTGLGLSIAYDIVKKHSGAITVKSEEGKGATFTVRIPVAAKA